MPFIYDEKKKRYADSMRLQAKSNARNNFSYSGGAYNASSFTGFGGINKVGSNDLQYSYNTKPSNEWNAAEASAYARMNNDSDKITELTLSTDQRGSQYWNPYRMHRATIPDENRTFWHNNFGYDGPYDEDFAKSVNEMFGPYAQLTRTMAVSTSPGKRSPMEVWAATYANDLMDNIAENKELDLQWDEVRQKLSDYYDQYTKINGKEPTLDEFTSSVDRTKYSKLNSIDQSLRYETKVQTLPIGTWYSPDVLAGLYYAKRNGEDITVDRDYFEDAVQYYMNPIQQSQSVQKYDWSGDDLSAVSVEERDQYINQKRAEGNFEEAAAFKYSWWAAQPHDDNITAEPSPLDARYGYNHDESWFEAAFNDLGDEYAKRLNYDGSMDNPGKNGDLMDKTVYQLYLYGKNREKTLNVENEYADIKSKIQDFFAANYADYTADDPEENYRNFRGDVLYNLGIDIKKWDSDQWKDQSGFSTEMNNYLENGYDPDKFSRDLPISKSSINAMIKRVWDGQDISENRDYGVVSDDAYEAKFGNQEPDEVPFLYDAQQRADANQRKADRDTAEAAAVEAVEAFADSGAQAYAGAVPVVTDNFARLAWDMHAAELVAENNENNGGVLGLLGRIWMDSRQTAYKAKLGDEYTTSEAAAADPVLNLCDPQNIPDQVTEENVFHLANAYAMSRSVDDDVTMAHGILGSALPGIEYLHDAMLEGIALQAPSGRPFNVQTYKNTYLNRLDSGYDKDEAASIALFAATAGDNAINGIAKRYEEDQELSAASQRLVSDIATEDGAMDTMDLVKAINDDVTKFLDDVNDGISNVREGIYNAMDALNTALIFGSSSQASAGLRAETNQLTYDFADGNITPEEVAEAIAPELMPVEEKPQERMFSMFGELYNEETYNKVLGEANVLNQQISGFFYRPIDVDQMSDEMKQVIHYDDIVAKNEREHSPEDADYYIDNDVNNAIKAITNPDSVFHTTPMMLGTTDINGQLEEIAKNKTEEQIAANQERTKQNWFEKMLTQESTGLGSTLAALFFQEDESDTGKVIDMFRQYGKFLEQGELDNLWDAFSTGRASFNEIARLVNERTESVDNAKANALMHPELVQKSVEGVAKGFEKLQADNAAALEAAANPVSVDAIVDRLMSGELAGDVLADYPDYFREFDITSLTRDTDMIGIFDDDQIRQNLAKTLNDSMAGKEVEAPKTYTPEQMQNIQSFIDLYGNMGVDGYMLSGCDNETLKTLYGINLEGTGFESGGDLLDALNPKWAKAFNQNPGYRYGMGEAALRGASEGMQSILRIPSLINNFFHEVGYAIAGEEYAPNWQYNKLNQIAQKSAVQKQNVATQGQAFVETGVAEATRNAVTSMIGGAVAAPYAVVEGSRMTGLPLTLANVAAAGDALQSTVSMVNHSVFAASAFGNAFQQNMNDGKNVWHATARALVDASIEMFTESTLFEKFNTLSFGGFNLTKRASNAAQSMGPGALGWASNAANSILQEVNEEEASAFLGRIVDTTEGVISGKGFGDSLRDAFEGYEEEAKNTAIATAFSTALLGAVDLGGVTAMYMRNCIANGTQADSERLMNAVMADLISNADSQQKEEEKPSATEAEEKTEQPAGRNTLKDYNPATDVPRFNRGNTSPYNPATDVPVFGPRTTEAQKRLDEAAKAIDNEDNSRAISAAAGEMMQAIAEDRAEAAQKQAEEAIKEQARESTDQAEGAQEEPSSTSENVQRVRDYLDHAQTGIDNAIIDKGAEIEAEKIVAEDAGLRSQAEAIEKMQVKIDETTQKINGLQQQAENIVGRMSQMFHAAMDEGIGENSPQVVNARNQLNQSHSAVQSDIGDLQEKQDTQNREMEEDKKRLDEETERIKLEAKTKSAKEYAKRLQKYKEKTVRGRSGVFDARQQLFRGNTPADLLQNMDADAQRELNAIQARQSGYDVNSMYTNEEDRTNREAIAQEQEEKLELYSKDYQRSEALEGYVDPASYRNKSNVSERNPEEWKDATKQRQDYLNSTGVEEEKRQRMRNTFQAWREENAPVNYVQIDRAIFNQINQAAAKESGLTKGDERYTKTVAKTDGTAIAITQSKGFSEKELEHNRVSREDRGYSENPEDVGIYSAADFLNEDGTVTGLAYRAIVAADPGFADNAVLKVNRGNGGVDASLEHITENNRFLVLATPENQVTNNSQHATDKDRYDMLVKENGLNYLRKNVEQSQKLYDNYVARINKAQAEVDKLSRQMNDPFDYNPIETSDAYKKAFQELTRAQNGIMVCQQELTENQKKLHDADEFLKSYSGKQSSGNTFYIIDKSKIEEIESPSNIYQDSVSAALEIFNDPFVSDTAIIESLMSEYEDAIVSIVDNEQDRLDILKKTRESYEKMSSEELGALYYDYLFQKELQKRLEDKYRDAVTVLRDGEKSANDQLKTFVKANGGYAADGFGGSGFAKFATPDYYGTSRAYFASEEAILKFTSDAQRKGLVIKPDGTRANFNATKAQYNIDLRSHVQNFAAANELSASDVAGLMDDFSIGNENPRVVGKATIIDQDDDVFFGIPTKNLENFTTNSSLREQDGSLSIDLAKQALEDKLVDMLKTSKEEEMGIPGKKLDTGTNSISVSFVDDGGVIRNDVLVGEYYKWWGGRFFPSYEQLMAMADKIVCNFPTRYGARQSNRNSLVSFTLVPKTGERIDLQREMDASHIEDVESELAYMQGRKEAQKEFEKAKELADAYSAADADVATPGVLNALHAAYNVLKADYRDALQHANNAPSDKLRAWKNRATKLYVKMNEVANQIRSVESGIAKKRSSSPGETVPEYGTSNDSLDSRVGQTAFQRYQRVRERYQYLTDPEYEASRNSNYDAERAQLAALLPDLKKYAEEEQNRPLETTEQPALKKSNPKMTETAKEILASLPNPAADNVFMQIGNRVREAVNDAGINPTDVIGNVYDEQYVDLQSEIGNLVGNGFIYADMNGNIRMTEKGWASFEQRTAKSEAMNAFTQIGNRVENAVKDSGVDWDYTFGNINDKWLADLYSEIATLHKDGLVYADMNGNVRMTDAGVNLYKGMTDSESKPRTPDIPTKLAVMKNLSDMGADIAEERTEAIEQYHEQNMEGMTGEEKIDYMTDVASKAAVTPDAFNIDPNTNYEEKVTDLVNEQNERENGKLAKRLKAISKTNYKTVRGIQNALAELDNMEKAGLDVNETRNRLNQKRETIENPNQQKIDTVIDSVEEPAMKMNLRLFADESTEDMMAEIDEGMNAVGIPEFTKTITTGFENTVNSIKEANNRIKSDQDIETYENTVASVFDAENEIQEQINENAKQRNELGERYNAEKEHADELLRAGVTEGNYKKLTRLFEELSNTYNDDSLTPAQADAARQNIRQEIRSAFNDPANPWTKEQRNEYFNAYNQYQATAKDMRDLKQAMQPLVVERNKRKDVNEEYKDTLLASLLADDAVNNRAVYGHDSLVGPTKAFRDKLHRSRRTKAKEIGNKFVEELHKTSTNGKKSKYTLAELAKAWTSAIDEKELALWNKVANALGHRVTELREKLAIIELAKTVAAGDTKMYDANLDKTMQTIMELHPEREYTEEEQRKQENLRKRKTREVQAYIDWLKNQYDIELDGDALYKLLDQQSLVMQAMIERGQRIAKNYYEISAQGIGEVFSGNHGGHQPAEMTRAMYSILRDSVKKWNPKHAISSVVDTFERTVDRYMGRNADAFKAMFIDPVHAAEGQITKRREQLAKDYEHLRKLDDQTKRDISICRDRMGRDDKFTYDIIRRDYGDRADAIIDGIETAGRIFDTLNREINVTYARNGLELLKRRNGYVPYVRKEKSKMLEAMGIRLSFDDVPTEIFGKTDDYVPAHEFFRFAYERKADGLDDELETDICKLLDIYIPSALNQIYQTDNIVRMRDMIDCIRQNGSYDDMANRNDGGLSNFVVHFEEYCNAVSGKKVGMIDRAIERTAGRRFFSYAKALTQAKGQAATAANMNVVVANFEPLFACNAVHPVATSHAIYDTIMSHATGSGEDFKNQSDFMTARLNNNHRAETNYQKVVNKLYAIPNFTDDFVTEAIVRAAYYSECKKLGISKMGTSDLHKKAMLNADGFARDIMASKIRGDKAAMYNTTWGTIAGQFLAEATNNISFLMHDLKDYVTNPNSAISAISGVAKAIAALLATFAGHELINLATGSETVPAPISAVKNAIESRGEEDSVLDTVIDAGGRIIEGLNPFDNLLDNQSNIPIIGSVPVVSSVEQTVEHVLNTFKKGYNAFEEKVYGKDFKEGETDWAYELASAFLGWAPAGVAVKRGVDTARAATKGHVLSKAGRYKYDFEPTAGNIALSALFGPNASKEGRAYVKSGYRTQSDTNTQQILSLIKSGVPSSQAVKMVNGSKKTKAAEQSAETASKFGEDTKELDAAARTARTEQGLPEDMSMNVIDSINEPWMQKAIDMWKETGLTTYPTKLTLQKDEERGYYFASGGKNIVVPDEDVEKLNADYIRGARRIIRNGNDAKTIAKELNDLKQYIKKVYLGGE